MRLTLTELGGDPEAPLMVLGPSLGTSARSLWTGVAGDLSDDFRVVGWDLPGHGDSEPAQGFDVAGLAAAVVAAVDELAPGQAFHYAGDSLGGVTGLQLLLDQPDRVRTATLISTGAKIGTTESWAERAELVRREGTGALVEATPARWFAAGFTERAPAIAEDLLAALTVADGPSYAAACDALAAFDVRDRLAEIGTPVLAVAGAEDVPTPPTSLRHIADGVQHGELAVLDAAAHLPPAEQPDQVAALIREHAETAEPATRTRRQVRAAGMKVRREVLGDEHVDRASAAATDLTADFQDLITTYAWGEIWTRPGLDRRSRSMITLTALIARGHHDELAMHVRAARRNGLSVAEIGEVILQSAIYCGVPDANTAFRIAQQALADEDA